MLKRLVRVFELRWRSDRSREWVVRLSGDHPNKSSSVFSERLTCSEIEHHIEFVESQSDRRALAGEEMHHSLCIECLDDFSSCWSTSRWAVLHGASSFTRSSCLHLCLLVERSNWSHSDQFRRGNEWILVVNDASVDSDHLHDDGRSSTISTGWWFFCLEWRFGEITSYRCETIRRINNLSESTRLLFDRYVKECLRRERRIRMLNGLALNTQDEIRRLIATGIFLMKLLYQIPSTEKHVAVLFPFDSEQLHVRLDPCRCFVLPTAHLVCFFSRSVVVIYLSLFRTMSILRSISTPLSDLAVASIANNWN